MKALDTKSKILKEGRSLLQRHGYNGYSFQDIADTIGIKKPSLYDHYSSKEELMVAILEEYDKLFIEWTEKVHALPPKEKIRQVFHVFYSFSCDSKKVCPVLALITDLKVLSKPVQTAMKAFIDKWLTWLSAVIKEGQKSKSIRSDLKPDALSQMIYSQIMGAQLQAKIKNNPNIILDAASGVLALISCESKS